MDRFAELALRAAMDRFADLAFRVAAARWDDSTLHDSYQKEYFGLRPHVLLLTYVRSDLWNQFMEGMK